MQFQILANNKYVDLAGYLKKYIEHSNSNDIKLYIGCDSQNKQTGTVYAVTVVIHIGNTGCHILYQRNKVKPVIHDFWPRLWKEVEKSVDVALYLRENGIQVNHIDLDLNSDPSAKSNKLVSAARGYVESLGIKANIKPDLLPAVSAADHIVNTP